MKEQKFSIDFAGRKMTIGVNQLAQQASGSCTIRFGDTVALCTATMGGVREGIDYFPLSVDFEERMYAAGRIKGSRFMKREGRPTDEAILSGRLIDRAIRPLFSHQIRNEVAVVATVLSHDQENDADIPALIGASCALAISDIPWNGPIAAVRVGKREGEFVLMPTYSDMETGGLDLVLAGSSDKTIMVEAGANRIPEQEMLAAIQFGNKALTDLVNLILEVQKAVGKTKQDSASPRDEHEAARRLEVQAVEKKVFDFLTTKRGSIFVTPMKSKADRKLAVEQLKSELGANFDALAIGEADREIANQAVDAFIESEVTRLVLEEKRRADGRALDEVRPIGVEVGLLPRTHGSGLFDRGATQVLSSATLGSPGMEQTLDTMEFQGKKRYFHHYNFPSYSVGETRSNRGPGRREIGHGALAERALIPVLPKKDDFPYTIRVVSEVLGSNGSSSMGATCGSTLALMDAGVPILAPVAGIAMGMASDEKTNRYQVITDLQDLEDGEGGMDFKIAGTRDGITAVQMDTKTSGLPWHVVEETFAQAKKAREFILDQMEEILAKPRAELSPFAPRIQSFHINPEKIRDVIGPGGKMINEIIAETNVEIDIEDDGLVMVTSANAESMEKAIGWIKQLTREVKEGETFEGRVTRILDFGAFVEILPRVEGLVHISELALQRVEKVDDILKVGDMIKVLVYEIDAMGRVNLSIKRLDPNYKPMERDNKPLRANKPSGNNGSRGPREQR
ncbi:polyribonucleotide nucleotidyltransferase [Candidatus Uhrbacteria bacterium CG22_combo_CG10-13_8_21_14_all_47_17]|uniref:Polyribonucleotide nucleotidyltransferase n=1 Tax=Candidatus Uhrbacteria bacterium CG22_combo_CG10-13_8_21_14_all_47_17 TaxID=1975041 RepID=A0A2H0BSE0_9BACT|nr:MAG: polyribonucleotide nucleotidyltransferase [Candidatus Uhrbacteria bacterium CG22_combo_CG10-13_8_21_14_all_47_17]